MHRIIEGDQFKALVANQSALALYAYLQAENGPDATFMIANGLAQGLGWPRRSIQDGRRLMLDQKLIECVRPPRKGHPALYRWIRPA
jgi:hypothetical protein